MEILLSSGILQQYQEQFNTGDWLGLISSIIKLDPLWNRLFEIIIDFIAFHDMFFNLRSLDQACLMITCTCLSLEFGISVSDAPHQIQPSSIEDEKAKIILSVMGAFFAKLAQAISNSPERTLVADYLASICIGKFIPTLIELTIEYILNNDDIADNIKWALKLFLAIIGIAKPWSHFESMGLSYQILLTAMNAIYKLLKPFIGVTAKAELWHANLIITGLSGGIIGGFFALSLVPFYYPE